MNKSKYIESPEHLLNYFNAYKDEVKNNPIYVQDFVGHSAKEVYKKKERPLTIEGFENYCRKNEIINDLGDYLRNKDGRYESYATIISHIKRVIKEDQLTGAIVGIYNANIISKLIGLIDKNENKNINEEISFRAEFGTTQKVEIVCIPSPIPLANSESQIQMD